VDRIPEDPEARRVWLERWAAEQESRLGRRPTPRLRQPRVTFATRMAQLAMASEEFSERVFDRELGTAVGAVHSPHHGQVDNEKYVPNAFAGYNVKYVPTAWHVLPRALRSVGASDRDTFVDFGCGKGRIVHQAAKWPLRRVIGVEVLPVLAGFARALVAAHSHEYRCPNVEIRVCNAEQFQVPDDLTIAYLFDPFRGETFGVVLRHIIESIDRHPRRVRLIYVNPTQAPQVVATKRLRLVKELRGGLRDVRVNRAAIFESC
jgi:SAM-dependent methyltransferase